MAPVVKGVSGGGSRLRLASASVDLRTTATTTRSSSLVRRSRTKARNVAVVVGWSHEMMMVEEEGRGGKRKVLCRSEGEGAAGGGGGGGAADGGWSLPWQKNKGGGGGGADDTEEALNKPNILWRIVSACMYFIPWIDAQQLSNYFYDQWSVLLPLYMVPAWPARLYCITPMAPLIWFFMLFSLVIRNKRLPHFLRFHTMQAMMTDIVVMLFGLTRQSLPYYIAGSWVDSVLSQYAFLCALLTVIWCIWKTLEGYYVELPFVSEAVYIQLSIADMM